MSQKWLPTSEDKDRLIHLENVIDEMKAFSSRQFIGISFGYCSCPAVGAKEIAASGYFPSHQLKPRAKIVFSLSQSPPQSDNRQDPRPTYHQTLPPPGT
jgi:hypothetical protein